MKYLFILKVLFILISGPIIYGYEYLYKEQGVIVDKIHITSFKKEISFYSIILDASVTEDRVVPDKYKLVVDYHGDEKSLCVSRRTYMQFKKGDMFVRCKKQKRADLSYTFK